MRNWISRTVLILSLVSLLNDVASESLYPVIPLYIASIGYGAIWIGILEGMAEAAAGLTKGFFGEWSDKKGKRLPFVRSGYLLSAMCKPLLALFSNVGWVFFMRLGDKIGKGVRTGARDAMLADESHETKRGKVFGFHRALDTAGAVIGPVLALVWLGFHKGESFRPIFYYALIPGIFSLLLLFFIREKQKKPSGGLPASPFSNFSYWKKSSGGYRKLLTGILVFTMFNSSDMFLLLLVKKIFSKGIYLVLFSNNCFISSEMLVVLFYIFYNFFYAVVAYPAGSLSDKFGPKKMLLFGYICFCIAYGGMAYCAYKELSNVFVVLSLFAVYGIFMAATEGVSKAWVSRICAKEEKGIALGLFAGFTSIGALIASVSAGIIWTLAGPVPVFIIPAFAALIAMIYLTFVTESPTLKNNSL